MNRCYFVVGLSACGKTALGSRLVEFMRDKGMQSILVDGDQMSEFAILKKYNGHDIDSRMQRGKDLTNLVRWLIKSGITPVVSVIGQPADIRVYWKEQIKGYREIQLKCDLSTCQKRDKKNLYSRAYEGNLKDVIGVDIPYEDPLTSDITIDTNSLTEEEVFRETIRYFQLNSLDFHE
jgi:adenylylsulfate kinase-like enzyme